MEQGDLVMIGYRTRSRETNEGGEELTGLNTEEDEREKEE